MVDFASINRREQICIVANTDILAAITHFMWLPSGSAVVEIQRMDVLYKRFRNVATMRGAGYFSVHTLKPPDEEFDEGANKGWHFRNMFIDEYRFIGSMEVVIKSMYHRGLLDINALLGIKTGCIFLGNIWMDHLERCTASKKPPRYFRKSEADPMS